MTPEEADAAIAWMVDEELRKMRDATKRSKPPAHRAMSRDAADHGIVQASMFAEV